MYLGQATDANAPLIGSLLIDIYATVLLIHNNFNSIDVGESADNIVTISLYVFLLFRLIYRDKTSWNAV